ncbi:MAG: glycosyltransferase family 4 protein [Candidatus Nanoarchaeia archaeon]|nr:glycosyltransferase family 4 protein [Candidatus Nanoarchaeia archaeon]
MKTKKESSKKMKILMLNYEFPPLGGGGGVASYKLAKGFIELGYNVDVVTTWFKGLKEFEKKDGINIYRVKVIGRKELPTASMLSMITYPILAKKIAIKLCKENQYEFIHTNFAVPTGPLGVELSKKFKLKNILSVWGGDIYDPTKSTSPHNKPILHEVVNYVLNNVNVIVPESNDLKEKIKEYYKTKTKVVVLPVAYETIKFKKISRKKLGLEEDLTYLVGVGRLVKRKGFDFFIKSIAELKDSKVHGLIIGDGPEKENLLNLAKEFGVKDRIHLLGFVNEEKKFQYLDNSNIFFLSSVHEGFGIVVQEAMQVGLPIISTNNGGQIDFVKNGANGYLIKHGNTKQVKEAMLKIQKEKAKVSKNNKQKSKEFGLKKICGKYTRLLKWKK